MPEGGLGIRWTDNARDMEATSTRSENAGSPAFSALNSFDRHIWSSARARIGIVTVRQAHLDVMQASPTSDR